MTERIEILKTYKLFINGALPRSESGRTTPVLDSAGRVIAHVSRASRKDLRDAVSAARAAAPKWRNATAYLRGQILYRLAEMMEGKKSELAHALAAAPRHAALGDATAEVEASIDAVICFAGWADKHAQVLGCANPVAGPYHNFTVPEPVGVVGLIVAGDQPLLSAASLLAAALCTSNAVVLLPDEHAQIAACVLAEACATADIPAGVVNILTASHNELVPHFAEHAGIDAVVSVGLPPQHVTELRAGIAGSLKRVHHFNDVTVLTRGPDAIEPFVEFKTMWHPAGA